LTANAIKSDGSVENVSNTAVWVLSDASVLTVSSTGLATGIGRGEASVSARFGGRSANARILVLPKGTFRLSGIIRESGFGIGNVTLTVISGTGQGLTTLSSVNGSYAFYGVSGPVRILAKKDGYLDGTQQLDVPANRTYDFEMAPERARTDYRGTYTLTISAPSCRNPTGTFPDAARRRVYTANVAQEGARLTVTLTDADFIVTNGRGNSFVGFVDITEVIRFSISEAFDFYYYFYYRGDFDIAERFNDTALLVAGTASGRGAPALISGTLNGSVLIARGSTPRFAPFSSTCHSETHGFEMARR